MPRKHRLVNMLKFLLPSQLVTQSSPCQVICHQVIDASLDCGSLSREIYSPHLELSDESTSVLDHTVVTLASITPMGCREASFVDGGSKVSSTPALPEYPDETSIDISRPDVKRPCSGSTDSDSMH